MTLSFDERIKEIATEVCETLGVALYDIEYSTNRLRIYIDSLDPVEKITVSLCARVSEALSLRLDILNLITHQYVLEVSSPGIERKLKVPAHFKKAQGKNIQIVLKSPSSTLTGKLIAADDEEIVLETKQGEELKIKYTEIKSANVKIVDWKDYYQSGGKGE